MCGKKNSWEKLDLNFDYEFLCNPNEKNELLVIIITNHQCHDNLTSPYCRYSILSCNGSQLLMLSNCLRLYCTSASFAKVDCWNHLTPKSTNGANVALNLKRIKSMRQRMCLELCSECSIYYRFYIIYITLYMIICNIYIYYIYIIFNPK